MYVPYGKGEGFAFGMGAAEQATYDPAMKMAYIRRLGTGLCQSG